jgi:hypothetical protein
MVSVSLFNGGVKLPNWPVNIYILLTNLSSKTRRKNELTKEKHTPMLAILDRLNSGSLQFAQIRVAG